MNINNIEAQITIDKYLRMVAWKPARAVAALVAAGMDKSAAKVMVEANAPTRKPHKPHKPHNSHAKPVHLEELSNHYIVVGDYELLELQHQDALIAAIRSANGKSSRHDGANAVKLFGLVKAYPVITTAEVNKYLNRDAFIDSITLFIDGEEIPGESMPSANNDYVKEIFKAVKKLKTITDGLSASGAISMKKYLERVPTGEDVKRAVGIVAPVVTNPHYNQIDYARDYSTTHPAHRDDSIRLIEEWKQQLNNRGSSKPRGRTLASDTDTAAVGENNA